MCFYEVNVNSMSLWGGGLCGLCCFLISWMRIARASQVPSTTVNTKKTTRRESNTTRKFEVLWCIRRLPLLHFKNSCRVVCNRVAEEETSSTNQMPLKKSSRVGEEMFYLHKSSIRSQPNNRIKFLHQVKPALNNYIFSIYIIIMIFTILLNTDLKCCKIAIKRLLNGQ